MPQELDDRLLEHDADSAVRPTIISIGELWSKKSQEGLLAELTPSTMDHDQQVIEC